MPYKRQRIRDPLHNLIEFRANDFENVMWSVIQTSPFQRLRRIKQLGFSEFVYPGATHTRFAHSIGVFHTARLLMRIVEEHLGSSSFDSSKAKVALAAALLHDVGHGPFSHAFEEVGEQLNLGLGKHEYVSGRLIRDDEINRALKPLSSGFAADVATMIEPGGGPADIYSAVVSSQFDADRLDYMRRDRLMTGTQQSAIDFDWLLSNLEVGTVPTGVDDVQTSSVETFVLGPKASYAAEGYVLGLFQLYPTVYFHKATRGTEKLFSALLIRVVELCRNGDAGQTNLPASHPVIDFASSSKEIEHFLNLDDTVIWGALAQMAGATDLIVSDLAGRLRDRRLYKCIDIRESITAKLNESLPITFTDSIKDPIERELANLKAKLERRDLVDKACAVAGEAVASWMNSQERNQPPTMFVDEAHREPYKKFQESKGPINQIMMKGNDGHLVDVANTSEVIAAVKTFKLYRVYTAGDQKAKKAANGAIQEGVDYAKRS